MVTGAHLHHPVALKSSQVKHVQGMSFLKLAKGDATVARLLLGTCAPRERELSKAERMHTQAPIPAYKAQFRVTLRLVKSTFARRSYRHSLVSSPPFPALRPRRRTSWSNS